jgi:hypothetical protein
MENELTRAEIEKRFAEINAQEPEELTEDEALSLAAAESMDDGATVDLEEFKKQLEEYSGRLVLRIPRSLHKSLKEAAEIEGVSLNQYMLYKLAK